MSKKDFDLSTVTRDGIAIREKGGAVRVLIRWTDDQGLPYIEGVRCLNPDASEEDRVYEKVFKKREIFLPGEYAQAVSGHLAGRDQRVLVIGMNGYSSVKDLNARAWHIHPDAYRIGCEELLKNVFEQVRQELPGVEIRFVHGCSNQGMAARGVDAAIINVAKELDCAMLGFSCPRYMFYVTDEDDFAVYMGSDKKHYGDQFVESLDVLITANGRVHTLEMDIHASIFKRKFVTLYDLLGAISPTGGPPAYGPDDEIEDAVKAFISGLFMVGGELHVVAPTGDRWKDDLTRISRAVIARCRKTLHPKVGLKVAQT